MAHPSSAPLSPSPDERSQLQTLFGQPLDDIAHENLYLRAQRRNMRDEIKARLKQQKIRFKRDIRELEAEYAELKERENNSGEELVKLRLELHALKRRQGQSREYSSLPHEILSLIFEETLPDLYGCDPAITGPGISNLWLTSLRTRAALTVVCKGWLGPATELLYSDIVFRRMGQISALARTFRELQLGRDLPRLVRSIRIDSCIVLPPFVYVVAEDLDFILQNCTRLISFTFRPHNAFPPEDWPPREGINLIHILDGTTNRARQSLCERAAGGLKALDITMVRNKQWLINFLPVLTSAVHLTSLALGPLSMSEFMESGTLPLLDFPQLESLQLDFSLRSRELGEYVRQKWQMPALKALTLINCDAPPEGLLHAHGSRLTYLHFYVDQTHWRTQHMQFTANSLLPRLERTCPAIEHLVHPLVDYYSEPLLVHSPTLRYLDVLHDSYPVYHQDLALSQGSRAPRLESLRVVMTGAVYYPRVCHPSLLLKADAPAYLVYRFPVHRIVQTRRCVIHGPALDGVLEDEDEDMNDSDEDDSDKDDGDEVGVGVIDDSDYHPDTSDEGESSEAPSVVDTEPDSNAGSGSDSGSEWSIAFDLDERRRRLLRMFRASRAVGDFSQASDGEDDGEDRIE
ncbi:hypothetical protein BD413DRAFT_535263 [Trametes elegans]|nr:hypothetical protein BD413DRAFT_535263 [Trametes elegans]